MRSVLVAVAILALGAATASAMPMTSAGAMAQSSLGAPVLTARHTRQAARRHAHHDHADGGIHPLVGSGNY